MKWICFESVGSILTKLLVAMLVSTAADNVRAGIISGSYSDMPAGTVIDLTAEGSADWIHWGLYTETSVNRKRLVPPQISDYSLLIGPDGFAQVAQYGDNMNGYSWSDGSPTASVTDTTTGIWAYSYPVSEGTTVIRCPKAPDLRSRRRLIYDPGHSKFMLASIPDRVKSPRP